MANNDKISQQEVDDFIKNPPTKYFLYINVGRREATTWTGQRLGGVTFGDEWRDNFGGVRISVDVYGVNGVNYHGTYYKSAGDYARITAYKNQGIKK